MKSKIIFEKNVSMHNYYIYIYAFSRRFYPKRLTGIHSGYTCFFSSIIKIIIIIIKLLQLLLKLYVIIDDTQLIIYKTS